MEKTTQDAEARIAAHRLGDFHLRLRDTAGAPVPRAEVTVRLVRHDFRLGANGFLIRGAQPAPGDRSDAAVLTQEYERAFANTLNYATLPFYWSGYEPDAGQEQDERLRAMAAWCHAHGVQVKGHPLAWHETMPAWAQALADADALRLLRERITRIVGGFRGVVDSWDVFNEATVAPRFENAVGRWVKDRGAVACVAEALRLARAVNPSAELLYNDFNVSPAFEELVGQLQASGAPFDAVGIQSHMHKGAGWSAETTWEVCETYARFGLPLHFTELTILSGRAKAEDDNEWHRVHTDWPSTPAGEQSQLEQGSQFYTLLFSHPAVEAITWWDFSDRQAWQGAPAGLLRNDMSPKPLALWLRQAFGERWTTCLTVRSDAAGDIRFRGFFGTYAVRAAADNGVCLAGTCALARRGQREAELRLT